MIFFSLYSSIGETGLPSTPSLLIYAILASIFMCFIGILWYTYCVFGAIQTPSVWSFYLGKYNPLHLDFRGIEFTFRFISPLFYLSVSPPNSFLPFFFLPLK